MQFRTDSGNPILRDLPGCPLRGPRYSQVINANWKFCRLQLARDTARRSRCSVLVCRTLLPVVIPSPRTATVRPPSNLPTLAATSHLLFAWPARLPSFLYTLCLAETKSTIDPGHPHTIPTPTRTHSHTLNQIIASTHLVNAPVSTTVVPRLQRL